MRLSEMAFAKKTYRRDVTVEYGRKSSTYPIEVIEALLDQVKSFSNMNGPADESVIEDAYEKYGDTFDALFGHFITWGRQDETFPAQVQKKWDAVIKQGWEEFPTDEGGDVVVTINS